MLDSATAVATPFQVLLQCLTEEGYTPQPYPYKTLCQFQLPNNETQLVGYAETDETTLLVMIFTRLKPPPTKQKMLMEIITHLNQHILLGNFDLDLQNNHLYFKDGLAIADSLIKPILIKNLLHHTTQTMNHYLPILLQAFFSPNPEEINL